MPWWVYVVSIAIGFGDVPLWHNHDRYWDFLQNSECGLKESQKGLLSPLIWALFSWVRISRVSGSVIVSTLWILLLISSRKRRCVSIQWWQSWYHLLDRGNLTHYYCRSGVGKGFLLRKDNLPKCLYWHNGVHRNLLWGVSKKSHHCICVKEAAFKFRKFGDMMIWGFMRIAYMTRYRKLRKGCNRHVLLIGTLV